MKTVSKNSIWLPALFEDLFLDNKLDVLNNYETFSIPAINIIENLTKFGLEIAAPGLQKENFHIEIEENTLKISYNKEIEDKETERNSKFIKREFNYENFERSFKLPENIELDKIHASYENGILKISLPKMEEKKVLKKMVEIS
ncbi:Hsp20/alpha crystallin family protein [Aequorivita sp. H23M31]|uniref:Hsp20/alpha crystallin family protein n=1 Tax=Aequorivita ciconiae TaxID=2494375 RepID=A0A451FS91_9FLAO|nr:Hsp20/alpha crystallin family protein [Aequorivita sp. H23M31]QAA80249.1 Hsp20/alpha crystallin family protein [Aequorivita sp. H23M31]